MKVLLLNKKNQQQHLAIGFNIYFPYILPPQIVYKVINLNINDKIKKKITLNNLKSLFFTNT